MILGENKPNAINSLKACIIKKLYSKEYLEGKITLLPTVYEDITQEDVDELLGMLNPVV